MSSGVHIPDRCSTRKTDDPGISSPVEFLNERREADSIGLESEREEGGGEMGGEES